MKIKIIKSVFFVSFIIFSLNFSMYDDCDFYPEENNSNIEKYKPFENILNNLTQDKNIFKAFIDKFLSDKLDLNFGIPENYSPAGISNCVDIHPPIYFAVSKRDLDLVTFLIDKSIMIGKKLEVNFLCSCPILEKQSLTKKYYSNINDKYEKNFSPLMIAAYNGELDIVKLLVERCSGDITHKTRGGLSALDFAVYNDTLIKQNDLVIDYLLSCNNSFAKNFAENEIKNLKEAKNDKNHQNERMWQSFFDKKIEKWEKRLQNAINKQREINKVVRLQRLLGQRSRSSSNPGSKTTSRTNSRSESPMPQRPQEKRRPQRKYSFSHLPKIVEHQ